ncbi:MAG: hypothetical protein QM571_03655 [Micrococcaceae bacterium]
MEKYKTITNDIASPEVLEWTDKVFNDKEAMNQAIKKLHSNNSATSKGNKVYIVEEAFSTSVENSTKEKEDNVIYFHANKRTKKKLEKAKEKGMEPHELLEEAVNQYLFY